MSQVKPGKGRQDPLRLWEASQRKGVISSQTACSVIIPQYGHAGLTLDCLDGIERHLLPVFPALDLIVVDDASPDDAAAQVVRRFGHRLRMLRAKTNQRFAKSCNWGATQARGRMLVFLNNDTQTFQNWLTPLLTALDASPDVGIVGAKLLYPHGPVQHAGLEWLRDGTVPFHPVHRGVGLSRRDSTVSQSQEMPAVTGACFGICREDFWRWGGFDEQYVLGGEDVDLCMTAHTFGKRIWYEAHAELVHRESQTRQGPDMAQRDLDNLLKLNLKWLARGVVPQLLSPPDIPTDAPLSLLVIGRNNLVQVWQLLTAFARQGRRGDRIFWVDTGSVDGTQWLLPLIARQAPPVFHALSVRPGGPSLETQLFAQAPTPMLLWNVPPTDVDPFGFDGLWDGWRDRIRQGRLPPKRLMLFVDAAD